MGDKPGPGGCRREACKTYCENPEHMDECLTFAEANGLMSSEELERAKKFGNKPGRADAGEESVNRIVRIPSTWTRVSRLRRRTA